MEQNTPILNDDQFKRFADRLPILVWSSDHNNSHYFFNSALLAFTGYDMDRTADAGASHVNSKDLQHSLDSYRSTMEKRETFQRSYRLKRHDGVYRWIFEQCEPRYRADGAFAGYAGYGVIAEELPDGTTPESNISGAKALAESQEKLAAANEELSATHKDLTASNEELANSREELLKREQVFKSIAKNIPQSLIVMIGRDHRFIAVEGDLIEKMGFNTRDLVGKHLSEVASLQRYARAKPLYERVLAGEQFTVYLKGLQGEDYKVEMAPLRDEAGDVYAGLVIALDVTEIKQAEEKSAKLAAIVTNSDDAIISKTLDGIVTSWNAAAEQMFGYTEEEMIGQSILKIIPPERADEEPRILNQLRAGHRVVYFETKRTTKDGRILDVSLTISPMKDNEGNIIGAAKIARDISERKRDEQRKDDFIGMVSHELKTPLTSLTAVMQLLQMKLSGNGDALVVNSLKNANKQVKRMAEMIDGFLDTSRLETGKMPIIKKEFLLNDLVKEAIEEVHLTGVDNAIHFRENEPVMVNADRNNIGSVILNLLNNAVKYSPKNSTIDVECSIIDGKAQVSVRDQGIGISAGDAKKLFDRFYRVESEDTRNISGFGIGLYLSAEIIRLHKGRIWVESEPGKGSVFYFTLPLS